MDRGRAPNGIGHLMILMYNASHDTELRLIEWKHCFLESYDITHG